MAASSFASMITIRLYAAIFTVAGHLYSSTPFLAIRSFFSFKDYVPLFSSSVPMAAIRPDNVFYEGDQFYVEGGEQGKTSREKQPQAHQA